jgi:4-amino-4-deoxy-L-arabinose transferase-like glycosyltransferase
VTVRACLRAPLFWILALAVAMRLAGIGWGLPASDGWDDDGFAPRNFLTALALTYKPGSYFTYPPLQAFLLALPTLPGSALALLHAHSLVQADVIREFTKPRYMTFFAIVARLFSVAMSLSIIICVGQMARLIAGKRAGLFAAAACVLGVTLTYYGQVTNLDVPYLFWSVLSLLWCMRAIARHEPARLREAALFAAAAIATKDQAYAIFLLSVPLVLLLWFSADSWPRRNASSVIPVFLFWTVAAIVLLLLIDGAITNPGGFAKRIAFLTGPASQDYANYPNDMSGRLNLLRDIWAYFTQGYAAIAFILAVLGLWFHVTRWRDNRPVRVAGLLPFLAIVSFTVCFNLVALRTDDRFLLPQAVLAAVYIGVAAEKLISVPYPWLNRTTRFLLAVVVLFAFHQCMSVSAAFLLDPRYDAEHWMAAHVRTGDTIETYGQNAYLPRFPAEAVVTRVSQTSLSLRNPLPGVTELRQPFDAIGDRNPRFIVVSFWWVQDHLDPGLSPGGNRVTSAIQQAQFHDLNAVRYFSRLQAGRLNYRLVLESRYAGSFWPPIHIHESLDEPIRIFERMPAGPP